MVNAKIDPHTNTFKVYLSGTVKAPDQRECKLKQIVTNLSHKG